MPKLSSKDILTELGAEPLDGSGFESEQPEPQDQGNGDPEVAE